MRTRRGHEEPLTVAQRLTDKTVKALPAPARGNQITYDIETRGFGARVTAAGAIAFVVNYRRKADGLERRYTIGSFPDWSVAAAREKAKELKRRVDGGGDPVGEHAADRAAPTVADLAARFLTERVVRLKPHTQTDYRSTIANDLLPALGRLKVAAVDRSEHCKPLHAAVSRRAPIRANRMLATAKTMFNCAIEWRMRADNPFVGIKRNPEHGRERYLSAEEGARFDAALDAYPDQEVADVFRLLRGCGARKGEATRARWDQFALLDVAGQATWTKPHTMTKQARMHRVPLSEPARLLLLRRRERSTGSPLVFPGTGNGPPDLRYAWRALCKTAGLVGVRIHDLRHSFASDLVNSASSLPVIGALLGHTSPAVTARYSHLQDAALRAAVNRISRKDRP
jgi:integrase